MKKIEAVIQPFKLDEVKAILAKWKIPNIAVYEVKGAGAQQGRPKQYRGAPYIEDSAHVKIEMVVDDDDAEHLAELIIDALRTGDLSDGEVIILPVERCVRLRAGERGRAADHWTRESASPYLVRSGASLKSYFRALKKKFYEVV